MQMLIDTATDDPAHIYAQAKMLLALFETVPVAPKRAGVEGLKLVGVTPVLEIKADVPPPPPPPPPSATTATAPAISTAIPTSARADALTDSAGVKWDHKLHTSTKTKDIDGRWKARKPREAPVPLHPATVPARTSAPPPPPPTVLVPSSDDEPDANVETDESSGPSVVPPGETQGIDFATFIVQITTALNAGEITQARISEVQKQFSLTNLFSLNDLEAAKLQDVAKAFGFVS